MITPSSLEKGSVIGIVAPARKITEEEILPALRVLESWGLVTRIGKNTFGSFHQFSGSDEDRAKDFQDMLDDNEIRAIICARGGYGTVRIIDRLDFSSFCKKPKWIVGYSDITVLLSHIIENFGIEGIHGQMLLGFPEEASHPAADSLRKALFGEMLEYNWGGSSFDRKGLAEGILTGGNLSILHTLTGSRSDINTCGKILFIEDLDEYLYHIDRMIVALDRAGKLCNIAGLVIGGMTGMNDNTIPFGKTAEEIIAEMVSKYKFPVAFGFPAGHVSDNRALIMGRKCTLKVAENKCSLHFHVI